MEIKELIKLNIKNVKEWEKHFLKLYERKYETENESPITEECNDEEISLKGVKNGIMKLKKRKAPGCDGIMNELLKYGGEDLAKELAMLFKKILAEGKIPEEWKTSMTLPMFKKGQRSNPENYRGITLLNATQKLLSKIVLDKLNAYSQISEEQQGFRPNRSTTDALFIIRQVVEKAIEFNNPAFICFVDLVKAFDRVKLQDVITILMNKQVPLNMVRIIKDMYTNTKTRVKVGEQLTKEMKCTAGIRQGDSLSPALFNLVMDEIIKQTRAMAGYRMGTKEVKVVCYADDAVLFANSEDNLQRLLFNFTNKAKEFNMEVSTGKTKSMVISKDPIRCKLEIDKKIIEQVMKFNYLGVEISSERNSYKEVKHQVMKGARISGYLRDVTWRN